MCYPNKLPTDDVRPNEDSVLVFAHLVTHFQWDQEELCRCGVRENDFKTMVQLLRFELLAAGLIEEAA